MVIKVFFDLIIRCLFSKPWPKLEPRVALSVGRFSQEKIQELGAFWANSVDLKHPGLTFAEDAGLEFESKEALKEKGGAAKGGGLAEPQGAEEGVLRWP